MKKHLFLIFGTRPEAIKLAPVLLQLRLNSSDFEASVCVTAQHRHLLDQVLDAFGIVPEHDLNIMTGGQSLFQSTSRIIASLDSVLSHTKPDMVLVQGDTTSTFCGALAAFYAGVPVGHIEAGLRTGDIRQPFPEEMNRVLTSRLAALHFAPTAAAARNLRAEGVPCDRIHVTGNSGIDSVLHVRDRLMTGALHGCRWPWNRSTEKLVLVTAHRRESFGEGFDEICRGIAMLAERPDVRIVYPVHPNPNVRAATARWLAGNPKIHLIDPVPYVDFVDLMRRSHLILTDSGGIQEEGPSLGKPILVLRDKTERPEAVEAGTARLVGPHADAIVSQSSILLDDRDEYERRTCIYNPCGDGRASERIAAAIARYFEDRSAPAGATCIRECAPVS